MLTAVAVGALKPAGIIIMQINAMQLKHASDNTMLQTVH
jgi:hypothetical protein